MSAYQVNGSDVSGLTVTYSWGLSPAGGQITLPGAVSVAAGTEAVLDLGGLVFYGVVMKSTVLTTDGRSTVLEVVDNRVKLMWDDVYCSFNNQEILEDDPTTPGIDRQKRFWHILPENWDAQIKTWTLTPYTARQIIERLVAADTVEHTWDLELHAAQNAPVLGVDALRGPKLGNVLQDITERQGLVFTLVGENTLRWVRKGEGAAHTVPSGAFDQRDGDALSNLDTQVRLVGDRNTYQDMPVALAPDWNSRYQGFWSEPAWFAEVNAQFGPFDADTAGQAALAAKARSVTLREYVIVRGDPLYSDFGLWGEVSRMEIPAWLYIRDIVFKAYRVPRDFTINGIPLESLNLREGLLAAVTSSLDTGEFTLKSPREYYPDSKAYVIAQGQQLSLLDPRTQNVLTATQLSEARTKWMPCNKFSLDTKNKVLLFEDAVFVPGAGTAGLFIFPNQAVAGLDSTHELYHLAVPNAGVTVAAAPVRAVLVFEAEIYSKRYGSGTRKGSRVVKDLSYHALMLSGVFSEEVKYADDEGADEKAEAEAAALILSESVYRAGGYRRPGACGTQLSAVLDRVTVTVSFDEGMVEAVEHTKERNQSNFEHEREMDRRSRQKDLFPGQKANSLDVENLRTIARVSKELSRRAPAPYRNPSEVLQRPYGASHSAPRMVKLTTTEPAGKVVWMDATGAVETTGTRFAGVVIADGSTGAQVALATQGVVPVLVKGPFNNGDAVGANSSNVIVPNGARLVGMVQASYAGTATVLAPVRIGGGAARVLKPLEPYDASEGEDLKITINWGTIGGIELDDFGPTTITETTYFFGKMTCDAEGNPVTLEKHTQTTATAPASSDTVSYHLLGRAVVAGAAITAIHPNLQGSQSYERCGYVGEYTHHIELI